MPATRARANPIPAAACAAGASWRLTYTGNQGGLNSVHPYVTSAALNDEWKPTDRLDVNLGIRGERDQYDLSSTNTAGKNFWFAAAQQEYCYNPVTLQPVFQPQAPQNISVEQPYVGFACPLDKSSGTPVQTVHPDGKDGHLLLSNVYSPILVQQYFMPRLGLTYSVDPYTVLRFSAGRYAQPPQAYEIQYNSIEENLANQLIGFLPYGFTTPLHDALPQYSNNVDFSYEHQFRGSNASVKVTPYYRYATNQLYTVSRLRAEPGAQHGDRAHPRDRAAAHQGRFPAQRVRRPVLVHVHRLEREVREFRGHEPQPGRRLQRLHPAVQRADESGRRGAVLFQRGRHDDGAVQRSDSDPEPVLQPARRSRCSTGTAGTTPVWTRRTSRRTPSR